MLQRGQTEILLEIYLMLSSSFNCDYAILFFSRVEECWKNKKPPNIDRNLQVVFHSRNFDCENMKPFKFVRAFWSRLTRILKIL